jgi:hypothetical protein
MIPEKAKTCALISVFLLAGCAGPAWYAQAVSGHLALMTQRTEISAVLAENKADPALLQDLQLAVEIREFAIDQLGLPNNGSYTKFARTGRHAVTWNIVVFPRGQTLVFHRRGLRFLPRLLRSAQGRTLCAQAGEEIVRRHRLTSNRLLDPGVV